MALIRYFGEIPAGTRYITRAAVKREAAVDGNQNKDISVVKGLKSLEQRIGWISSHYWAI
jgi:hypothetical protein